MTLGKSNMCSFLMRISKHLKFLVSQTILQVFVSNFSAFTISNQKNFSWKMVSILEGCAILFCAVCFVLNSYENMIKFIKSQTTIAVSIKEEAFLDLPAVTFCNFSGFKNEKVNTKITGNSVTKRSFKVDFHILSLISTIFKLLSYLIFFFVCEWQFI